MRLATAPLFLVLAAAVAACSDTSEPNPSSELSLNAAGNEAGTGRHIVLFSGAPGADFNEKVAAMGGRVDWSAAGIATLSGLDDAESQQLAGRSDIKLVMPDIALPIDLPQAALDPVAAGADVPSSPSAPNTSFFYARQWNMRAIGADRAWAAGKLGSSNVTAYILDTGIDYNYPDLAGLVDPARSVDLLGKFQVLDTIAGVPTLVEFSEADTVKKYFPSRAAYTDLFYHGTHVAATVSSNALVTAGVGSRTRLAAVKVCAYLNICPFSSVLNGVIHAADQGADVINMSLGGGFAKAGNGAFVDLIGQVFSYARSKGSTIVVSAGNAGSNLDNNGNVMSTYCDAPGVICVSATGPTNQVSVNGPWTNVDASASYTNFGRSVVDVAAPGGNINPAPAVNTFVYAGCSQTSLVVPVCRTGIFAIGALGTSMASPHVAGTAALLVAEVGRDPSAITARLRKSADDLGQSGTDPQYGAGRLNVARAVGVIR